METGRQHVARRPTSNYFAGDIDEAAVYLTCLTAARVQAHYAAAAD